MDCILTINVGSSSLKFALFEANEKLDTICSGDVDNKHKTLSLITGEGQPVHSTLTADLMDPHTLIVWLQKHYPQVTIKAVGHRIVHGGKNLLGPTKITRAIIDELKALIPLAPLHIPEELNFIEKIFDTHPELIQVASFDTSFHRVQPRIATLFAIPRKYTDEGIIRYGFHGLSYEYSSSQLAALTDHRKRDRVVVAHLGNGASVCAISSGKSIATSMGLTALDGLMMGTRCGNIDPGVLIFLIRNKGLSVDTVETMLYKESGLLGVSGITADVKDLLANKAPEAQEAIDLFCYRAAIEIAAMVTALKGLDTLVFTGGIGEHAVPVRHQICERLNWLGIDVDANANQQNSKVISKSTSKVEVRIIEAKEDVIISRHTLHFILNAK